MDTIKSIDKIIPTRDEIKKLRAIEHSKRIAEKEKRNLEGRLLEYWYSFVNDSSYPAKEPNRISIRQRRDNVIVYDKIVFVKDKDNINKTKEVYWGGGAITIQDLEKREEEVRNQLSSLNKIRSQL